MYELRAAFEALYATREKLPFGVARHELEANSEDTLRMTACWEARRRGKKVVVVCTRPIRLTSMQSRMTDTSVVLGFWPMGFPNIPARKHSIKWLQSIIKLDVTCVVDENVQFAFTLFNDILCNLDGLDVRDIEMDESDVKVFLPQLPTIASCKQSCTTQLLVLTQLLCPQFRS